MASIQKISSNAVLMSRLSTAVGVSHVKPASPSSASYQVISAKTPSVGYFKKPQELSETLEVAPVTMLQRLPSKRWEPSSNVDLSSKIESISIRNQQP